MSDVNRNPESVEMKKTVPMGGREPRVMAQSVALAEKGGPDLMKMTVAAAGAGVLGLLAWAGFMEVDEVTRSFGQVIPVGEAETVRHPEGGTVAEILAIDGEIVEQGQILIRFDAGDARAEMEKIQIQRTEIGLMAAGFRALGRGGEPDYSFVSPAHVSLVEKERLVFTSLRQLTEKRRQVLSLRAASMQEKLDNIAEQEKTLSKKASLLEDELELRQDLYKKGQASKKIFLKAKQDVEKVLQDLADLAESGKRTARDLKEARPRSREFENRLRERALDDLGVLTGWLDGINESLEKLKNRIDRLDVQAPAKGVVRGVRKHALGSVIEPGSVVFELLPLGGETAVEARVAVKHIDRLGLGQPVTVTVKAPGFSRYGGITGKITEISSSTFNDDKGRPYYRVRVALDRDSVGRGPGKLRIMPGMKVEAKIKTGSRTLFARLTQ